MRNFIFTILVFISFNASASIAILSDLDDTIKITQSSGSAGDLLGDKVFTAIPDFFRATKDYSNELHVLSASPEFIRGHVTHVLHKHVIRFKSLTLRESLLEDKFDFKLREIKRILDASSDDFILIGDDLGEDPEVYAAIALLYPQRILDIYIRIINGRPLKNKKSLTTYYTSFDLFLREYVAGRMSYSWVKTALDKLIKEVRTEYIFPKKAKCPTTYHVWKWQYETDFSNDARALVQKLTAACRVRQSVNILP